MSFLLKYRYTEWKERRGDQKILGGKGGGWGLSTPIKIEVPVHYFGSKVEAYRYYFPTVWFMVLYLLYQDKLGFNLRLGLTCTSSWVHHPEFLDLIYTDRIFLISVDPTGAVETVLLRV